VPKKEISLAAETKAILRAHRLRPREQLGQNFLIDEEALASVVRAADLHPGDQVLEVGPGIGTLTLALAETGARVRALELDEALAAICRDRVAGLDTVQVHVGNVLHADLGHILDIKTPFSVVANIPYYITGPIVRLFLEGEYQPLLLVMMVQWEVALRLAAPAGEMSALSVFTQVHAAVDIVRRVPATSFLPPPAVDSAIVRLRRRSTPIVPPVEQAYFFRIVRAGFSARRKMLHNALDGALPNAGATIDQALHTTGIARTRRAETLSIEEWLALSRALREDIEHLPRAERARRDDLSGSEPQQE
jgi:16S rRNA (adenine1518-N6/adenine1519-N6)-dimethyltransferase